MKQVPMKDKKRGHFGRCAKTLGKAHVSSPTRELLCVCGKAGATAKDIVDIVLKISRRRMQTVPCRRALGYRRVVRFFRDFDINSDHGFEGMVETFDDLEKKVTQKKNNSKNGMTWADIDPDLK